MTNQLDTEQDRQFAEGWAIGLVVGFALGFCFVGLAWALRETVR